MGIFGDGYKSSSLKVAFDSLVDCRHGGNGEGNVFFINSWVSPGHSRKRFLLMAFTKVFLAGEKQAACRYSTNCFAGLSLQIIMLFDGLLIF